MSPSPQVVSDAAIDAFVARVLDGEFRAGARAMRLVDDRSPHAARLLKRLYPHTGRAQIVGITGNPGAGKSTITDRLIARYRAADKRVAVIAVDPSSPFSGGAILGDRIRMMDHASDPGVFIRSVATRGHLGGVSRSTNDLVAVVDAMGFDIILVETVGVGQDEVDVIKVAQTVVVVTVPGLGDDIQAIKAGLLEVADIFVVNKADREGVDRTVKDIRVLQSLGGASVWRAPIIRTVAPRDEGIDEIIDAIAEHRDQLPDDEAETRALRRAAHVVESQIRDELQRRIDQRLGADGAYAVLLAEVAARTRDPYSEAERIVGELLDGEA